MGIDELSNTKKKSNVLANHPSQFTGWSRFGVHGRTYNRRNPTTPMSNDKNVGEKGSEHGPMGTEPYNPSPIQGGKEADGEIEFRIQRGRSQQSQHARSKERRKTPRQTPSEAQDDEKQKRRTEQEHMDTHGILLNQILTNDFGKPSGREDKPGKLKGSAVESRNFIFLNSSINSPQITSTVIRPRPLSPSRSCLPGRLVFPNEFEHGGAGKERRRKDDQGSFFKTH